MLDYSTRCPRFGGRGASFADRVQRLFEMGIIDEPTKTDLKWVWDIRHVEFGRYGRADCNRAIKAYCALRDALTERYGS